MSTAADLPEYEWPPLPILDSEVAATILSERLQAAWDDLERQRLQIALQLAEQGRVQSRSWVAEFQSALASFIAEVQFDVTQWLRLHLGPVYELAVVQYVGGPMEWSLAHRRALASLATDTYGDFLQRAYEAERVSSAFVTAVRRASARELPSIAAGGRTARQGGDQLAQRLIDQYGINHVTYRNGAEVEVRHYARMAARTKSAVAYNAGSLNAYHADGVAYVEVFDGAGCGWKNHDDPDKAGRTIRPVEEAARYVVAHPNCSRGFGPRPDITTPEEAAAAVPFGPESLPDRPVVDYAAGRRNVRERAAASARAARQARRDARTSGSSAAATAQSVIDAAIAARGL